MSKRHYIGENPLTQGPMEIQPFTAHFKKAQAANPLLAPLTFSTPLCKVRYQKMAAFAERCCFFCGKTASFSTRKEKSINSLVFLKKSPAFSEKTRGPPSEIWFRDQIYKRSLQIKSQALNEENFCNEQCRKKGIAKLPVNQSVHRPGG